jgi:hypothetical protein
MAVIVVRRSPHPDKKWQVTIPRHWGVQTIDFGDKTSPDYTTHRNLSLAVQYHRAHQDQDWSMGANGREHFWTRWLLWNKPTIQEAIADMSDKFNLKFYLLA